MRLRRLTLSRERVALGSQRFQLISILAGRLTGGEFVPQAGELRLGRPQRGRHLVGLLPQRPYLFLQAGGLLAGALRLLLSGAAPCASSASRRAT